MDDGERQERCGRSDDEDQFNIILFDETGQPDDNNGNIHSL